ncbi:MAG: crossover junction endodeoxyribonuclease RuvC [Pseudomonadota bacterium]|nr:crossover junction endodeoxyribonuclease RuvC [Pseudomonadota bacterium]
MLILGIDPGSTSTGFGLVRSDGSDLLHVHHSQVSLSSKKNTSQKLSRLYYATMEIMDEYHPDLVAVEGIFYGPNVKSMIVLGQARGAAMVAVANCGREIAEYPPTVVKQAVVGYGKATKEQVQQMVSVILNLQQVSGEHAADALAVAICHHHHQLLSGWEAKVKTS